jgi:hypothetical protein
MSKVLALRDEELDTIFYFEVGELSQKYYSTKANRGDDEIPEENGMLSKLLTPLHAFGKAVHKAVETLKPDEVEFKVGMKVEFKTGKWISVFANAGGESNIEVTLTWKPTTKKDAEKAGDKE